MKISKPYIEKRGERVFLCATIQEKRRGFSDKELWYSVPCVYESFLCDKSIDAFILPLIPIALAAKEDIVCEAPVSKRLYFNIINLLNPLFCKIIKDANPIDIKVTSFAEYGGRAAGVGCGCSLGVDSLASFYAQQDAYIPEDYRVSHLALFNCGQLGDDNPEKVEENFKRSIEETIPFSRAVDLPIVSVDSNINEFYSNSGVTLLQSFVLRTISCAMALQNGWGRYVYGSSYPIDSIGWSTWDASHMESAYVPLLSTEIFEPILANSMMGRVQKTDLIAKYSLTAKYLRVCWAEQTALETWHNMTYLQGKTKINCGWCDKCLRTLFTLEVLGYNLNDYAEGFELSKYYEHREAFILKVVSNQDNVFYKEILGLILEKNFKIPHSAKRIVQRNARQAKIRSFAKRVVNRLKRLV